MEIPGFEVIESVGVIICKLPNKVYKIEKKNSNIFKDRDISTFFGLKSEGKLSYNISLKLRSPDPDPVSIFLNVYLPIVLLVSLAAPRQIGNKSNSYQAPFLVRATYKSIFNCDLGIVQSLSITKGGSDRWNVMGQPYTADVTLTLKDLYSSMFISKMMGIIANTAEMDYLATMAGVNLNDYEFTRLMKMAAMILRDAPRDYVNDFWGGIKRSIAQKGSRILGNFSDVRSLGW